MTYMVEIWTPGTGEPLAFSGIQRISFVNSDTYGKAPVVSDPEYDGDRVLYINPAFILAGTAEFE